MAQSAKPEQLGEIDLSNLTPFQRALLGIDGAVTPFIEAYTMEPVEVVRLHQQTQRLSTDHVWLQAPKGTAVVARQVLLRGVQSTTLYAYAVSLIVLDRLPEVVKEGLAADGEGLGDLLRRGRVETRRELLWYGLEHARELPDAIRYLEGEAFISRTYRIIANGQPMMLINEKFPSRESTSIPF
ncbi:MAG: chorismate pyruvate-lyase family protein [Candidatus Poribacteria bacterium]|nr:chorismate pyruvate-lyase family protein [Candidatus Poribacteria bacterium]